MPDTRNISDILMPDATASCQYGPCIIAVDIDEI